MKIKLLLLTMILVGIFALAGCGGNATTTATENVTKPMTVKELVEAAASNANGWKGKEVVVRGSITFNQSQQLTMGSEQYGSTTGSIICSLQAAIDDKEVLNKVVEVKGKVNRVDAKANWTYFYLEPCEIKK